MLRLTHALFVIVFQILDTKKVFLLPCPLVSSGKMVPGVTPLSSGEGFPFVVIEYFKNDIRDRPTDAQLRIDSGSTPDLSRHYKKETNSFQVDKLDIENGDNRIHAPRWIYIDLIVVIAPSPEQTYFSESLDHPHYSVHPLEYQSYLAHLKRFQRQNGNSPKLRFCDGTKNHSLKGRLTVTNRIPPHVKQVMDGFDLPAIASLVAQHGKRDDKRGNVKLDTGLASAQCQTRRPEWYGLSGPNQLKLSHEPP